MSKADVQMHGRTHRHGGSDPIRWAAYATLFSSYVHDGIGQSPLVWDDCSVTDDQVFSLTNGDTWLNVLQEGVCYAQANTAWEAGNYWKESSLNTSWRHSANTPSIAPATTTRTDTFDARMMRSPTLFVLNVTQVTATNKTVLASMNVMFVPGPQELITLL